MQINNNFEITLIDPMTEQTYKQSLWMEIGT